jgi:dipeptidyl aminopeptidase/acylaminoacyl peptidase
MGRQASGGQLLDREFRCVVAFFALQFVGSAGAAQPAAGGYREPSPAVVELLTAAPPPEPLLHATSRRVALLHHEGVVPLERVARPSLGLAGFRFDPTTGTSDVDPRVERIEIVDAGLEPTGPPIEWKPSGGAALTDVRFSPDGRNLSAIAISEGPARLVVFDVEKASERVLDVPVNAAWGEVCAWLAADALLCRLVPSEPRVVPPLRTEPRIVEHPGGKAPVRTYSNLLDNAKEDALFEYYFVSELARVGLDGSIQRYPGSRALIANVLPSPDGSLALVTEIHPPYSRLVQAKRFPRRVELWDLAAGVRLRSKETRPATESAAPSARRLSRSFSWRPGTPAVIGWIEASGGDEKSGERWMTLSPPYLESQELARSERSFNHVGWTTAGTPLFVARGEDGSSVEVFRIGASGPERIWQGSTEDRYGDPGHPLRVDGDRGPWLEVDGKLLLAGDGLGADGPQPYLESFDLRTQQVERLFTSPDSVFEPVLGLLDLEPLLLVTSRETESEPPNLQAVGGAERRALRPYPSPYPALDAVERRIVSFPREDGVTLGGTLYLPAGRAEGERLPTLVWIYPREFSDAEYAEQIDVRRYRFHHVRGPSALAVLLEGYAVLWNPTMPIIGSGAETNDEYIDQLTANAEAAVQFLVDSGTSDPERIAIAGHSYGAFSSANLLVHTQLFRTGVLRSGAYNRTLTPFGFQREKRSFWKASDLYARLSPFFYADQLDEPVLLIHGGADENPGTPTEQSRRFFHALVGNGNQVRFVELPYEGHTLRARESVLHAAAEMLDWLERMLAPPAVES